MSAAEIRIVRWICGTRKGRLSNGYNIEVVGVVQIKDSDGKSIEMVWACIIKN